MKEAIVHKRFYIVPVTKNVLNMANSADPDETPRFAASHLGIRYLQFCLDFFVKALTMSTQLRTLNLRQSTPVKMANLLGILSNENADLA